MASLVKRQFQGGPVATPERAFNRHPLKPIVVQPISLLPVVSWQLSVDSHEVQNLAPVLPCTI
jgi:hypothetical protein